MAVCKGCGAEIVFARTDRGGHMPLDSRQTKIATVRMVGNELEILQLVVGHVPHHITCPKADEFRRRGKTHDTRTGAR